MLEHKYSLIFDQALLQDWVLRKAHRKGKLWHEMSPQSTSIYVEAAFKKLISGHLKSELRVMMQGQSQA